MDARWLMLEELYKEARSESLIGRPVMELPADKVLRDDKGRIFVDLRVVIDQMQVFIAKGEST